jgi:hypothetical protein
LLKLPKEKFVKALVAAASFRGLKWDSTADRKHWQDETFNNIRGMLKEVKRAQGRTTPPKWLKSLALDKAEGGHGGDDSDDADADDNDDDEDDEDDPDDGDSDCKEASGGEETDDGKQEDRVGDEASTADGKANKADSKASKVGTKVSKVDNKASKVDKNNAQDGSATPTSASKAASQEEPKRAAKKQTVAADAEQSMEADVQYTYGFDEEKQLATRKVKGSKKSVPAELCLRLEEPPDPKPYSAMVAVWKTGPNTEVAQVTVAKHRGCRPPKPTRVASKAKANRAKKDVREYDYSFKKETEQGEIEASLRDNNYAGKPKQRLVRIRDWEGQVIQLDVKYWLQMDPKEDDPDAKFRRAENSALKWACGVAEMYYEGNIDREGVKQKKLDFIEKLPEDLKLMAKGKARAKAAKPVACEDKPAAAEDEAQAAAATEPKETTAAPPTTTAPTEGQQAPPVKKSAIKTGAPNNGTKATPPPSPTTPEPRKKRPADNGGLPAAKAVKQIAAPSESSDD